MSAEFKAQEVAFRQPGRTWKRRVVKTASAFDALVARLVEQGAQIEVRDAEVGS